MVYTLPKNTTLEQSQKLESIMDIGQMQVNPLHQHTKLFLHDYFLFAKSLTFFWLHRSNLPEIYVVY